MKAGVVLLLNLAFLCAVSVQGEETAPAPPEKVYRIGLAPADVDTPLEKYLGTVNGIDAQCSALGRILESVCCARYQLGCNVRYVCETVDVDREILMTDTAYGYVRETGYASYPMNHGAVLADVLEYLKALQLYSRHHGMLIVGVSRHRIRNDDESTKVPAHKINTGDLRFQYLGMHVPGETDRGRMMILNYYAAEDGILLNLTPSLDTSLTQALAEFRSAIFSFDGKVFTGTGARDLFELAEGGKLVPNQTGCFALAEREPPHLTRLIGGGGP